MDILNKLKVYSFSEFLVTVSTINILCVGNLNLKSTTVTF